MQLASMNLMVMDSRFHSEPFRFIVDGKPVYMHRDTITNVSKPLDRLVNGAMREAQIGEAELKDVNGETFSRFCQWAYSGHYPAAESSIRPEKEVEVKEMVERKAEVIGKFGLIENFLESSTDRFIVPPKPINHSPSRKRTRRSDVTVPSDLSYDSPSDSHRAPTQKQCLEKEFRRLWYLRSSDKRIKEPPGNLTPSEDFTPVFLSHAQVYVFAERYDVRSLKRVACYYLHETLKKFEVFPECVGDIVALIRFVYENTLQPDNKPEHLRKMLMLFVGCEMESLVEVNEFQDLLNENKELMFDFCDMVAQRISD